MPQCRAIACAEDSRHVFLAGGGDADPACPQLTALTFDSNLQIVHDQILALSGQNSVYAMQSLQDTNALLLGLFGCISIVYFTGEQFHILNTIEDLCQDEVSCLRLLETTLYVSFPSQENLFKINFPKVINASAPSSRASAYTSSTDPIIPYLTAPTVTQSTLPSQCDWLSLSPDSSTLYLRSSSLLQSSPLPTTPTLTLHPSCKQIIISRSILP